MSKLEQKSSEKLSETSLINKGYTNISILYHLECNSSLMQRQIKREKFQQVISQGHIQ